MDIASAADELYAEAPDGFVAARTRLARQARAAKDTALAKQITALRRPTLSAWAVNLLARTAGDEVGWLLDVGADLRDAWTSGGSIRGLEQRRGELITLLGRRARELAAEAGHPLRDPAVREVEDTLLAATVDPEVAEETRLGRLVQPRSHTGFVSTGLLTSAPREPSRPREASRPREPSRPRVVEAKPREHAKVTSLHDRSAEIAKRRKEKADRELAEREAKVAAAREEFESAGAEVRRLERELALAVDHRDTVRRRLDRAEQSRDRAADTAAKARSS